MSIVLATVSALLGAGATFFYLAKPMEQWNVEFNETFFSGQMEALQALRDGKSGKALQHLEFVGAHSLQQLAKAKLGGAETPRNFSTSEAISYLCAHPPVIPGATTGSPPSIEEACATLQKQKQK
ncbi:MAG: hypothetical protein EOP50_02270 [Sphingobacteriales bacterium]|nr:MAG: hypothetical protein EOP50_02270 [Sphingobacteriales bacterium]